MDTIFALASGSRRAGVAIVRVSGPAALDTVARLTRQPVPAPRHAVLRRLSDASDAPIDNALVLCFAGPASFTGEDVAEYHLHGGRAVIDALTRALGAFPGCRMAEPGEFTRRAFENGKIDLTGAEAVADLIAAETDAQRIQALGQMDGALSRLYGGWTERLKNLLAHQEADIEFPDEDLPPGLSDTLRAPLDTLLDEIHAHLNDARRGERLRDGLRVAIIGAPNAGKSSLLNALARREAAIVSDQAGTTRDVIEAHLDLGGYPVTLSDTAGLRDTADAIETEGIRRARHAAAQADLKIALFDGTRPRDAQTTALCDDDTMIVMTRRDLGGSPASGAHWLSPVTGAGMDDFLAALTARIAGLFDTKAGEAAPLTRARHRAALEDAAAALIRGRDAPLPELAAEDLRLALRALGRITGRVHVEDVLDSIFRDFCIGK